MKTALVCVSVSHGNTRRIAEQMAPILAAPILEPEEIDPAALADYDLVGFGSGIFNLAFHPRLRDFVRSLPAGRPSRAFVYVTSGFPPRTHPLIRELESKGYEVVDTFACRALDTWLPFKAVGGIRKGHPDSADLAAARAFAEKLRDRP